MDETAEFECYICHGKFTELVKQSKEAREKAEVLWGHDNLESCCDECGKKVEKWLKETGKLGDA